GSAIHVCGGEAAPAIATDEEQAPVARGDRVRQRDAKPLWIGDRVVDLLQPLGAHTLELGVGHRLRTDTLDRVDHRLARGTEWILFWNLGEEHREPRIVAAEHEVIDG